MKPLGVMNWPTHSCVNSLMNKKYNFKLNFKALGKIKDVGLQCRISNYVITFRLWIE